MSQEIIQIDAETGEIIVPIDKKQFTMIKESKIKALQILRRDDFVNINGTWEAKKDGLLKILSSLPISYSWEIKESSVYPKQGYAKVIGVLSIQIGEINRHSEGMGICEKTEFTGAMKYTLHNLNAKAETRALKRSIDVLFGSVINYYVINYLERAA
jgi:hypothetical protein